MKANARVTQVKAGRNKSKKSYNVKKNLEFDKAELTLYEAVEKMPPFSRKTLVLVSPPGLGKQQIIRRLVESNPDMFGTTMPSKLQKIQAISALIEYFRQLCLSMYTKYIE